MSERSERLKSQKKALIRALALSRDPRGMTMLELAEATGLHYQTSRNELRRMESAGLVVSRRWISIVRLEAGCLAGTERQQETILWSLARSDAEAVEDRQEAVQALEGVLKEADRLAAAAPVDEDVPRMIRGALDVLRAG